ncbi:MAG: hypothetical protein JST54_20665 [Deltaproteobacteria bacterium]|nr:hypothetical protein [Deltaproteobacteria bacterium]
MLRALVLLALLAPDGGALAPVPAEKLRVENLGASPVTLVLQRPDGSTPWGPFELGAHEIIEVGYCPCANLTLELRAQRRKSALRYPLHDQTAILLSEDRWSEGDPIVRRDEQAPTCAASSRCAGPDFHIGR